MRFFERSLEQVERTQGSLISDALTQEIPGTDSRELRKTLHQALGLRAFAYTGSPDENYAGRSLEFFGRHCERGENARSEGFGGKTKDEFSRRTRGGHFLTPEEEVEAHGLQRRIITDS